MRITQKDAESDSAPCHLSTCLHIATGRLNIHRLKESVRLSVHGTNQLPIRTIPY